MLLAWVSVHSSSSSSFSSSSSVLSQECFIFVNDFTPLRPPTGGGKKLYMSMPQDGGGLGVMKGRDTRQLVSEDNERCVSVCLFVVLDTKSVIVASGFTCSLSSSLLSVGLRTISH